MIEEADGFIVQPIKVGRLDDSVAMPTDITVALIIRENENDVRRFRGIGGFCQGAKRYCDGERNRPGRWCRDSMS